MTENNTNHPPVCTTVHTCVWVCSNGPKRSLLFCTQHSLRDGISFSRLLWLSGWLTVNTVLSVFNVSAICHTWQAHIRTPGRGRAVIAGVEGYKQWRADKQSLIGTKGVSPMECSIKCIRALQLGRSLAERNGSLLTACWLPTNWDQQYSFSAHIEYLPAWTSWLLWECDNDILCERLMRADLISCWLQRAWDVAPILRLVSAFCRRVVMFKSQES